MIVSIQPYCSPDINGPNYEQYCKQKLLLHVKFRQLPGLLMGNITFIEAYQFLLTADVPSSLEEDVHRLEGEQPVETDDEEVFIFTIHDIRTYTTFSVSVYIILHIYMHKCTAQLNVYFHTG